MKKLKTVFAVMVLTVLATAQSPDLKATLTESIKDEQRSQAFYAAVMKKFGDVRPFSNIVRAEGMHEKLVADLMKARSMEVPSNAFAQKKNESDADFIKRMKVPATLKEACQMAAKVEKDQGPFYEAFMKMELPNDVRSTFTKLRDDSLNKHLRAFERCAGRA